MRRLPLHIQLAATLLAIMFVMSLCFVGLAFWSNQTYHHESTQRLYAGLARYIVEHQEEPLIQKGVVNKSGLKHMAHQAMAINPLIEVFLLDTQGNVLGHALPQDVVKLQRVDMAPIHQRLQPHGNERVVYGDNPRVPGEQRVFSVSAVNDQQYLAGYLYVVLNSQVADNVMQRLQGSHIAQLILLSLVMLLLLALVISYYLFRKITGPIRQLSNDIDNFQHSDWMASAANQPRKLSEIDRLKNNFTLMKQRIISQFQNLQESSRLRRELISNVSHDLRTPLASLQGYIEALLIKEEALTNNDKKQYLMTAHRNSQRLTLLVNELFELSKLEAGQVKPALEKFSLLELVYDVVQDYELAAESQQVSLKVSADDNAYFVVADIALIQRVLQNLIDNAMRFTPEKGEVNIRLEQAEGSSLVTVADTGFGIKEKDLPHIFDAYYSTHNDPNLEAERVKKGTGLGLAIVKRILELHNSDIKVQTVPNAGTAFRFQLGC
ncbi:MAG: HAMP domain-containing histidine kinase [Pseudomonadales bacterium]|nr:HAMP domain-containing histidine kinase [Pseudomonadales bacterium]